MAGVNPAYIARQLGHANMGMLLKVYGKWIDGADKGAEAAKVSTALGVSNV
jgi:integrase